MKYRLIIIVGLCIIIAILAAYPYLTDTSRQNSGTPPPSSSFAECVRQGNPIEESYPRRCSNPEGVTFTENIAPTETPDTFKLALTVAQAEALARASEACATVGPVLRFEMYNQTSRTWWFALTADRPGCAPACVIYDDTSATEVNPRCTGLFSR